MNRRAARILSTCLPLLLPLLLWPARAGAAPLRIVVHFRPPAESSAQRPARPPLGYLRLPSGVLPIAAPIFDPRPEAILLLTPEAGTAPPPAPPAKPVELSIYGQRITPAQVALPVGAQLTLRNDDRITYTLHRPQALSAANPPLFSDTQLSPGARVTVPVAAAGEHVFASKDHPHTTALLVALRPGEQASSLELGPARETGVARFEAPEGRYTLTLLLGLRAAAQQAVTLDGRGTEATFNAPSDGAL